jgi:hypothetical protein
MRSTSPRISALSAWSGGDLGQSVERLEDHVWLAHRDEPIASLPEDSLGGIRVACEHLHVRYDLGEKGGQRALPALGGDLAIASSH